MKNGVISKRTSKAPSDEPLPAARGENRRQREVWLKGIPASPGICFGDSFVLMPEISAPPERDLPPERIAEQHARFDAAVSKCTEELTFIINTAQEETPTIAPVLEAQLLILNDYLANESIHKRIDTGLTAETATINEFDEQEQRLRLTNDQILRERALDLEHVKQRILAYLRDRRISLALPKRSIVTAASITPAEIMLFNDAGMLGYITEISGIAGHTSILARSLGIPAVIGVKNALKQIEQQAPIIIDGYSGVVISRPKEETIEKYKRRKRQLETKRNSHGKLAKLPAQTIDGKKIHLLANIDFPEDIDAANASGAEGVGLLRTEHLIFKYKRFPNEDEQYEWYRELADRAYPSPVTIRAFDIGSDKALEFLPAEPNPALGLRGMRFLMQHKDLFASQIRAVLRASSHKNIRFMLPMVSSVTEFRKARATIEKIGGALKKQKVPIDTHLPIGAMIETPSAALIAHELGAFADFFSIGTNDLTQYTLAADRINAAVANYFDAFHPAVLRLIKHTVEAARRHNIPVGICGEIAGHAAATQILIGLGVNELSVVPSLLNQLKKRIRKTHYATSALLSGEVIHYASGAEIRKKLAAVKKKK